MSRGLALIPLTAVLLACPGPTPPPVVCTPTQAGSLFSGECDPPQNTTFCLFTQNTGF